MRRVALARPGVHIQFVCVDVLCTPGRASAPRRASDNTMPGQLSGQSRERPASHSGRSGGFMNVTFSKLAEKWQEQGGLCVSELDTGGKTCRVLNLGGEEI